MTGPLTRIIIKRMPVFWLVGLLLPLLYLLYVKNIKRLLTLIAEGEPYSITILFFIFIQLISVVFSIPHDYFSIDRLVAILHNIAAFSFLLLGFVLASFSETRNLIQDSFRALFLFLSLGCVAIFLFSTITNEYVEYPGVLYYLTGISNDFTNVVSNQEGWIAGMEFPRSRIMGIFPNSTGLLLLVVYVLYFVSSSFTTRQKLIYGVFFVMATITTASRILILFSAIIFLSQFIKTKRNLVFLLLFIPIFLVIGLFAIEYLSGLRQESNDTRFSLYWESIKFSMSYNPFLGLGLKPKVPEIAEGELPLGSHSTLLGYFVKNGITGGFIALFFYLYLISKALLRIVFNMFQKSQFSQQRFTLNLGMIFIMFSLLFDDLDAYEIAPFFLGYLLFIFKSNGDNIQIR